MAVVAALLLITAYTLMTEATYQGAGKIYFTHAERTRRTGIKVIYKPENYVKYSALGQGEKARMGFLGLAEELDAKSRYSDSVLGQRLEGWVPLLWEGEGNYYYHEQTSGTVESGDWFGFGVDVYDKDSQLIYEDINHFYVVPSPVQYCELDGDATSSDLKCSQAIEGSLNIEDINGNDVSTPSTAPPYYGSGKVFFTHTYESPESGIKFVYQPVNRKSYMHPNWQYDADSPEGEGAEARIQFYGYATERQARAHHSHRILAQSRSDWVTLQWENTGKYYYHQQRSGSVDPGEWFGYGVAVYNRDEELIYEDVKQLYEVPSAVEYCKHDEGASNFDLKCSEAVVGSSNSHPWHPIDHVTSPTGSTYNGTGNIYFTHYSETSESGFRVIYRPEYYARYSGESFEADIGFLGSANKTIARLVYEYGVLRRRESGWALLKWHQEGKYYYYESSSGQLDPGGWYGYGVAIYNSNFELVYQDINHFYHVPPTIEYCEHDDAASSSDTKCSEVLKIEESKPIPGTHSNSTEAASNTELKWPYKQDALTIAIESVVGVLGLGLSIGIPVCRRLRGGRGGIVCHCCNRLN